MELPRHRGPEPSGKEPEGTEYTARRQDFSLSDRSGGHDWEASSQDKVTHKHPSMVGLLTSCLDSAATGQS